MARETLTLADVLIREKERLQNLEELRKRRAEEVERQRVEAVRERVITLFTAWEAEINTKIRKTKKFPVLRIDRAEDESFYEEVCYLDRKDHKFYPQWMAFQTWANTQGLQLRFQQICSNRTGQYVSMELRHEIKQ